MLSHQLWNCGFYQIKILDHNFTPKAFRLRTLNLLSKKHAVKEEFKPGGLFIYRNKVILSMPDFFKLISYLVSDKHAFLLT